MNNIEFKVVYNDEGQYSIWPIKREVPSGWYEEGTIGTKETCLDQIEVLWTDLTPKSARGGII